MVFGWFKKKKKTPENQLNQSKTTTTQGSTLNTSQSLPPNKSQTMQPMPIQPDYYEDQWMYDSLLQFLTSPLWKVPIYTFLDENCIIFDDEEENKFTYTDVHNEFKKLIEGLVESVMKDLGINEEKFMEIMERGLKNQEHRKVFEQLLIVDNFLVFKKLMVKRNKELELEALKQLDEQEKHKNASQNNISETQYTQQSEELSDYEKATIEREQAEIEHAIALSLAIEKERMKMLDEEDKALQEALKQSEQEFKQHQLKEKEVEKLQLLKIQQEEAKLKKEKEEQEKKKKAAEQPAEKHEAEEKKEQKDPTPISDSEMALMGMHTSQQKKIKEKPKAKENVFDLGGEAQKEDYAHLPPLRMNGKFDNMDIGKLLEEKEKLDNKAEQIKKKEEKKEEKVDVDKQIESLEERKQRLKAQREMILAKKKAEREEELKKYKEEEKPITLAQVVEEKFGKEPKEETEESQKRSNVYKKLKDELLN